MGKLVNNLVALAILAAAAYYLWNWGFAGGEGGDAAAYAESSCVSEIRQRFDTTTVRANSVRENANGYTVRATMTLARGNIAKVTCLTNHNGRVEDVLVDER